MVICQLRPAAVVCLLPAVTSILTSTTQQVRDNGMNTAIPSIVVIVAALGTAGIVSAIGFSTPVHGQATHAQGGTCTGPDKVCSKVVTTPSGNTNVLSQSHTSPSAQLGGGATVIPKFCVVQPTQSCGGGVNTPNGNVNTHGENRTSP